MFSINYGEEFIIYNCEDKTNLNADYCMFYYDYDSTVPSIGNTSSSSFCMRKKIKNEDNICCHYRKKKGIENEVNSGCIELNKFEIERFKWNIPDSKFESYNDPDKYIIQFECESELFKLNKYIFLILFIIFFNF